MAVPTIEDRIRMMRSEASPPSGMSQNDAMTTWEPTGEVIPIAEYNRRQESAGRATKESRIGGGSSSEPVSSPHGQVPWWVAQERRQGALTSPVPLSTTLPAPGEATARQQQAGRAQKDRPLPSAPQGVSWEDMQNYTVWEPTGEVVTIDEYNQRQVAAGRATKEAWVSGDPNELEDTDYGRVPKWLRYERSTGAHTTPARLTDVLPAPGAAAAAEQRRAASGKGAGRKGEKPPAGVAANAPPPPQRGSRPKARMMRDEDVAAPALDREAVIDVRAAQLANAANTPGVAAIPTAEQRRAAERELVERGDIPPSQEHGVLPGEEQVTTFDTFLMLPPEARMELRTAHLKGGHADTMDFNDWLSDNFSDLPPQQRIAAMREIASRKPAPEVTAPAAPNPQQGILGPAAGPELAGKPNRGPTPEQQQRIDARRQDQYAREIGNRYSNMLSPEEQQMIDWAATAPNGMEYLRRLNADLRRRYERDRHTQVRDRATNYNLSQDLRNPNYAPGMGVRSLIDAVRSGNSEMAGAVYDIYGNPVAGGQSRQLAGVRARAAADQQAAQIDADNALQVAAMRNSGNGDAADPLKMEVLARELDRALANPDPVRRHQAVRTVIAMNPANQGMDAVALEAETQRTIASHMASSGSPEGRQYAMKYLDTLKGNKDMYMSFAVYSLRIPPETAEQMYNEASKPRSWRDAGRQAGAAVGNAPAAVGDAATGFGAGLAEGFGLR